MCEKDLQRSWHQTLDPSLDAKTPLFHIFVIRPSIGILAQTASATASLFSVDPSLDAKTPLFHIFVIRPSTGILAQTESATASLFSVVNSEDMQ